MPSLRTRSRFTIAGCPRSGLRVTAIGTSERPSGATGHRPREVARAREVGQGFVEGSHRIRIARLPAAERLRRDEARGVRKETPLSYRCRSDLERAHRI